MRKVTMKDIAQEAGVSTATVSYILNNVNTQSISEDTRERVMKASQRLNYIRNLSARSLKSGKSELIGIVLPQLDQQRYWSPYNYARAIYHLGQQLNLDHYQLIVVHVDPSSPELDIILEREMDGVFVFDMSKDNFLRISKRYGLGMPVIAIDCYVEDALFQEGLHDFEGAFEAARTRVEAKAEFLIVDNYGNRELIRRIGTLSGLAPEDVHIYQGQEELERFLLKRKEQTGYVVNEFLCQSVLRWHDERLLVALCTCGCPELLPPGVAKVVFETEGYRNIAALMTHYIHNPHQIIENKYIYLEVAQL